MTAGLELSVERGADGGHDGLGDGAGVLRGEKGAKKERQEGDEAQWCTHRPDSLHSDGVVFSIANSTNGEILTGETVRYPIWRKEVSCLCRYSS